MLIVNEKKKTKIKMYVLEQVEGGNKIRGDERKRANIDVESSVAPGGLSNSLSLSLFA